MKVYKLSNKTMLVRHWLKWYRVMRGGTDWHELKIEKRVPPFNISKVAKSLQQRYPSERIPDVLDEVKADREVAKILKKNRPQKKGRD